MLKVLAICFVLSSIQRKGFCQSSCNGINRFQCGDGICISSAKKCNGKRDCSGGEDERNCDSTTCSARDLAMKDANNYACKGPCKSGNICNAPNKECICDDECGPSCVNPDSVCKDPPPEIEHSSRYHVKRERTDGSGGFDIIRSPPYKFRDVAMYVCNRGRKLEGPLPRCHARKAWSGERPRCVDTVCRDPVPPVPNTASYKFGKPVRNEIRLVASSETPFSGYTVEYVCNEGMRRNGLPPKCDENRRWTSHTIKCVVPCYEERDSEIIANFGLQCGQLCDATSECPNGMECYCDVGCSRVCVDPDVNCGDAPDVPSAHLNYTGSGIRRVARYKCQDGYYLHRGQLSIRCSGSGVWTGDLPDCRPVTCGDPGDSIRDTGGQIYSYEGIGYGNIIQFSCRGGYRMLGAPERQCMGNGKWSGVLTVCDRIDHEDRCPHPGYPINGRLTGRNFSIGATVKFECDQGFVMYGSPVQTCLWFKQWNGTAAPKCEDPKYPHTASDVVGTLTRSLSNLPDSETSLGRSIQANDIDRGHEIYFMFDISQSVLKKPGDLKDEIEFAKRLVRRMEGFKGNLNYGIMVFASANVTALDISTNTNTPAKVIETLDTVYNEAAGRKYQEETRSGTATAYALTQLRKQMAFMLANDDTKGNKRHVFIFTDGQHTEGEDPVTIKRHIESEFRDNVEFYSITACQTCNDKAQQELKGLSSGEDGENYIFIEDFYQLSKYLDRVTDVKIDFGECGQAGDVGSIKDQATLGRAVGGVDAAENAWPWQALITKASTRMERSLSKNYLLGGGSIIHEQWILTAAHVLNKPDPEDKEWMEHFVVFVGVFERPRSDENVRKSVEAYSFGDYFQHAEFDKDTLVNDIALIKLGTQLDGKLNPIQEKTEGLTFGYYIRPVCLPCTGTCLKEKQLVGDDGNSLVAEDADANAKCRAEEVLLLSHDSKAVVTGFGHLNQSFVKIGSRNFNPPRVLQQALLKIVSEDRCRNGIADINDQLDQDDSNLEMEYSESMLCCESGIDGEVVDACKGDSGGPLVREVLDLETQETCWVQIGIVSFGYRCGLDFPGFYTNVAKFIPWINDAMGGLLLGPGDGE